MYNKIYIVLLFILCISAISADGQEKTILDFQVKDMDGNVSELRDILDPNTNYFFETMAFWCIPCRRSMDDFSYHRHYWKERFNLELIMIEDEHFDDLPYVENLMNINNWDLTIVVSDGEFGSAGINAIPRYFFKSAVSDTIERVTGNKEHFFLERLDSIYFTPLLEDQFDQTILNESCEPIHLSSYSTDTIIDNIAYTTVGELLLREDHQNGNILRYDPDLHIEKTHIKYSAPLCSDVVLNDSEGNSLEVKIMDKYQVDGRLHVLTDLLIENPCTGDSIPFTFIQGLGTNAGLDFTIRNNQITSRLVCHQVDKNSVYVLDGYDPYCLTNSTVDNTLKNLSIYPNPTLDVLTIESNNNSTKRISIYSIEGKLLHTETTKQSKSIIDMNSYSGSSIYLVEVQTDQGSITKKVVKR